jgi:hypothetical protein
MKKAINDFLTFYVTNKPLLYFSHKITDGNAMLSIISHGQYSANFTSMWKIDIHGSSFFKTILIEHVQSYYFRQILEFAHLQIDCEMLD